MVPGEALVAGSESSRQPTIVRIGTSLSMILASRGSSSQISMPGTLVAIGSNSPRISLGASDLEVVHVLMRRAAAQVDHDHRLVRTPTRPAPPAETSCGSVNPPIASPPMRSTSRRVIPLQKR